VCVPALGTTGFLCGVGAGWVVSGDGLGSSCSVREDRRRRVRRVCSLQDAPCR